MVWETNWTSSEIKKKHLYPRQLDLLIMKVARDKFAKDIECVTYIYLFIYLFFVSLFAGQLFRSQEILSTTYLIEVNMIFAVVKQLKNILI